MNTPKSDRDSWNIEFFTGFKLTIHGTGYPFHDGHDELDQLICQHKGDGNK